MIYRLKPQQGDTVAVPQLVFARLGAAEEASVRVALYVLATGVTDPDKLCADLKLRSRMTAESALAYWAGAGLLERYDENAAPGGGEPGARVDDNGRSVLQPAHAASHGQRRGLLHPAGADAELAVDDRRVVKDHVALARGLGLRCILATNPLFPPAATRLRIGWAGLRPEDFELITTYDNCSYCKPNPDYYRDILRRRGLDGAECLMVGNDAGEDAEAASAAGISAFLLTDCLINRSGAPLDAYPHGGFPELKKYIASAARAE